MSEKSSQENQSATCELCGVVITEKGRMEHESGKRHKENILLNERKKSLEREVHVRGFRRGVNVKTLYTYMSSNFGSIDSVNIFKCGLNAIIKFQTVESATAATASTNKMFLEGSKLYISPRKNYLTKKEHNKAHKEFSVPSVSSLNLEGGFENQLRSLLLKVRKTQEEVQSLATLCIDLESALQSDFPGCRAIPFGSMVSGLALKGSDVDCYIQVPREVKQWYYTKNRADERNTQAEFIRRSKSSFYGLRHIFTNIIAIPTANTPIVKFMHIPTKTSCDINFKNVFGICNTSLIRFLILTDHRLVPLFIFIKYWANTLKIVGPGRFSNYAFSMMVFFYLQQLSEPVIPPISYLQRDPAFCNIEEGWNCGFDNKMENFPKTKNSSDVLSLLHGFFEYYSNFDFKINSICTLTGKIISKTSLNKPEELPPEVDRYIAAIKNKQCEPIEANLGTCICLDPFEQSRNVAKAVSLKILDYFQNHCKLAVANILTSRKQGSFESLIQVLLDQKVAIPKKQCYKVTFSLNLSDSAKKILVLKPEENVSFLVEKICPIFNDIISKIFKCTYQYKPPVNSNPKNLICCSFTFKMYHDIWSGRKALKNDFPGPKAPGFDFEVAVSEHMVSLVEGTSPNVLAEVTLRLSLQEGVRVTVLSQMESSPKQRTDFGHALIEIINKSVESKLDCS